MMERRSGGTIIYKTKKKEIARFRDSRYSRRKYALYGPYNYANCGVEDSILKEEPELKIYEDKMAVYDAAIAAAPDNTIFFEYIYEVRFEEKYISIFYFPPESAAISCYEENFVSNMHLALLPVSYFDEEDINFLKETLPLYKDNFKDKYKNISNAAEKTVSLYKEKTELNINNIFSKILYGLGKLVDGFIRNILRG